MIAIMAKIGADEDDSKNSEDDADDDDDGTQSRNTFLVNVHYIPCHSKLLNVTV